MIEICVWLWYSISEQIGVCGENEMFQKYTLCFDIWGFLLFLIIMMPNFIWFAVPAPNDILRTSSITETLDTAASVCQIFMVAALCIFRNSDRDRKKRVTPFIIIVAGCCLLYFLSWIVYYKGIVNVIVVLGLTIPPCFAFLFFAIDRKNGIALTPILIFTICHLIYGVINFVVWLLPMTQHNEPSKKEGHL